MAEELTIDTFAQLVGNSFITEKDDGSQIPFFDGNYTLDGFTNNLDSGSITMPIINNLFKIPAIGDAGKFFDSLSVKQDVNNSSEKLSAVEVFKKDANEKMFLEILEKINNEYNKNPNIISATYKISFNSTTNKYTITVDLVFSQKIQDMCDKMCLKLKDGDKYKDLTALDLKLTNAATAYIAMKNSPNTELCNTFKDAFEEFNNLLNDTVGNTTASTTAISAETEPPAGAAPAGAATGTGGPGAPLDAEAAKAAEAARQAAAEAEAAEAARQAAAEAEAAAETPAEDAAREGAAKAEEGAGEGGKRKVKKGGANVGGLNEIYNARDLVKDDHPPAEIVGSADQNMAQYSPASFSAGSMLSQDMAQGIAMPSQELLNPLSSQQVGGAKKKVLKKKKRSDSPKKSKK